jgi:hypothetical protein
MIRRELSVQHRSFRPDLGINPLFISGSLVGVHARILIHMGPFYRRALVPRGRRGKEKKDRVLVILRKASRSRAEYIETTVHVL